VDGRRRIDPTAGRELPKPLPRSRVERVNRMGIDGRDEQFAIGHRHGSQLAANFRLPGPFEIRRHGRPRKAAASPIVPVRRPIV
jgi:hypothetical protein